MIISCIENEPCNLAADQLQMPAAYLSRYPLRVGVDYPVIGMLLFGSILYLLVEDDQGYPLMAPAAMFSPVPVSLPSGWKFGTRTDAGEFVAVWGYPELVENERHYPDLTEWKKGAMEEFRRQVSDACVE